ncbi:MAG: hypothetical protein GAK45_01439 [Pseudomonas citronellolis]|nr:MAG: hypothetical protein GAK45_01439 [Pseudomonas citronellolis]
MPDYKAAFNAAAEDLGAITALLGFARYPGIDLVLRAVTDLILTKAEAQALREEVARSEQHRNGQADLIVSLRTEVAALRARMVVVPDEQENDDDDGEYAHAWVRGWNECRLARLNGKVVSEGLLRRASETIIRLAEKLEPVLSLKGMRETGNADVKLADELNALLGQKEGA